MKTNIKRPLLIIFTGVFIAIGVGFGISNLKLVWGSSESGKEIKIKPSLGHVHTNTEDSYKESTTMRAHAPGSRFKTGAPYDPTNFDYGRVVKLPDGREVREFSLVAEDKEIEVAPGVKVMAWTFNGTAPGPVLRATEEDLVRVRFINKGNHPHTIHFHGVHPANMDGVFEIVPPGGTYTYEFSAKPFGIFPYHCHMMPNAKHIQQGMYGMLIVDPKTPRPPAKELAFVMNAFDLDRDGEADFYAWNGRAFQYADDPIRLKVGEPVRVYVVNLFEEMMAPHIHGNVFKLYPSGTTLTPTEVTDVKGLAIAERAILEFTYEYPGRFMFQCHFSEHMELGLMGWFDVAPKDSVAKKAAGTKISEGEK